jgi:hypothetical protein
VVQATIGGQTVNMQQNAVNEGAEWGGGTLHAALLEFPRGIGVGAITKITLDTQFEGDNWDVNQVMVQAAVVPNTSGCTASELTLVNRSAPSTPLLSDGHPGLVRMLGGCRADVRLGDRGGTDRAAGDARHRPLPQRRHHR